MFSNRDYAGMWGMSSESFKQRNENNQTQYVSELQRYNFGAVKAKVLKVSIAGSLADVTMRLRVWSNQDKKWMSEILIETWVTEGGVWKFAGQSSRAQPN